MHGARGVVVDDAVVIEFDTGLHDEGDDARPDGCEARFSEDAPVDGEGFGSGFAAGGHNVGEAFRCATGDGHFSADDIDGFDIAADLLGGGAESGGARGDDFIGERRPIICAGHAGVEMDFLESGAHVSLHHQRGFAHGFRRRFMLPGIGAEMVTAEDEAGGGETAGCGDASDQAMKVLGRHAGVPAVVIDLVGRGLDQQMRAVFERLFHSRFKNPGMGGTD